MLPGDFFISTSTNLRATHLLDMVDPSLLLPWVGDRLDGVIMQDYNGEEWRVDSKLSDRRGDEPLCLGDTREVVATYLCTPVAEPKSDRHAIAKIRMQ